MRSFRKNNSAKPERFSSADFSSSDELIKAAHFPSCLIGRVSGPENPPDEVNSRGEGIHMMNLAVHHW